MRALQFHRLVWFPFLVASYNDSEVQLQDVIQPAPNVPSISDEFLSSAPEGTRLRGIVYNGSGCKDGTLTYTTVDTDGALSYFTPDLRAASGPGNGLDDQRRFCQVNIDLTYPEGYQYTLGSVQSRGYVSLVDGAEGMIEGSWWFTGSEEEGTWQSALKGPMHSEWTCGSAPTVENGLWSPCGTEGMLTIKLQPRMSALAKTPGLILADWTNVFIQWRKC